MFLRRRLEQRPRASPAKKSRGQARPCLHGHAAKGQVHQQHAAQADRQRRALRRAGGKAGCERRHTEHQPAARQEHRQARHLAVEGGLLAAVDGQAAVLALLLLRRRLLRHQGSIAHHGFHQLVGEMQARVGPVEQPPIEPAHQSGRQHQPANQEGEVKDGRRTQQQHHRAKQELEHVGEQHGATGARESIQGVSLQHRAQQVPDPLDPHLIGGQAQDAFQQALAHQSAHLHGQTASRPHPACPTRHESQQQHGPRPKPAPFQMALQGRGPQATTTSPP